jgi:hypothetical protein
VRVNKIRFIIISVFILSAFYCHGQYINEQIFPDSIKPFKPKVSIVLDFDSLKPTITDTLHSPEGFIFQSGLNGDYMPYVALRQKNFYKIFLAMGGIGGNGFSKAQRIDFDGKGNKELLMEYEWNMGNNHFSEYHKGFYLWDLDKTEELMEVEYSSSYWLYPDEERDSTGEYYQADTSDHGTQECYHFEPIIKKGRITFTEAWPECNWEDARGRQDTIIANPQVIKYRLTNTGIIRLNYIPIDSVKQLFKKGEIITSFLMNSKLGGNNKTMYLDSVVKFMGNPPCDTAKLWVFDKDYTFTEYSKPYYLLSSTSGHRKMTGKGIIKIEQDDYHIYVIVRMGSSEKKYVFESKGFESSDRAPFYWTIHLIEIGAIASP